MSGTQNRGSVDFIETESTYVLDLIAKKYAILTYTWLSTLAKSIHVQMDNVVALSYLMKMGGGRQNKALSRLSKEMWNEKWDLDYCRVSSRGNEWEADTQSRNVTDSSEWKLNPVVFQKTLSLVGNPRFGSFCVECLTKFQLTCRGN